MTDSSGLRLYYTERLRTHDAGILSVGIDPNWRHIIPPGQREVVSEGHCVADCTGQTVPESGVNMFAVIMHTHQLGRKVRLRQIRTGEEMPPIASDTNYDPNYQEYRRLQRPIKVYPVSYCFDMDNCVVSINIQSMNMFVFLCSGWSFDSRVYIFVREPQSNDSGGSDDKRRDLPSFRIVLSTDRAITLLLAAIIANGASQPRNSKAQTVSLTIFNSNALYFLSIIHCLYCIRLTLNHTGDGRLPLYDQSCCSSTLCLPRSISIAS